MAQDVVRDYPGESCIVDPQGEDILMADCSAEHIFRAKAYCDVAGHDSRPDVFQLRVNKTAPCRVVEVPGPEYRGVGPEE